MALEYRKISLPAGLFERIRRFLDDYPGLGYRSVSEFVTRAAETTLNAKELHEIRLERRNIP